MDEEERRALAALAAKVGRGEDQERPPPRGLTGRLRAVWNAKDVDQLKRAVGLSARHGDKEEPAPWPPLGTYIEEEAAAELRAAAASVGTAREDDRPPPAPPSPPDRSALMDELGRAAASVGGAEGEAGPRRRAVVDSPAADDEAAAPPRPAMSDGEKAFCIVSPLPWIADIAAGLYLGGRGADADTASLILLAPTLLSYLLTGLGGLLIFLARRRGRPLLALWAATLVAASLFLWWLISTFALLVGRSWLISLGWL